MKIKFQAYNIVHQFLRTDNSYRITMDISKDQVENVKDIILSKLPEGMYEVTIEPLVEEQ